MTVSRREPPIERMERIQPLQAGQYWRALDDVEDQGIDAGTVLLIESIRWVENTPHTIILRPHPDNYGKSGYVTRKRADGSEARSWVDFREHRFLLSDFLSLFEFEPDYQRIRNAEIAAVRGRIDALQGQLMEAQSNPAVLSAVVADGLREAELKAAETREPGLPVPAPASSAKLAAIASGSLADAMASAITPESIAALEAAAHREHQIATIKSQWISGKTTAIGDTVAALTPYYLEQAAAALASTEDVRTYIAKLLKGIATLDLYVGKDVAVETIREGAAAPKGVPLTFVQRKLMMDEELAVYLDLDDWFDFEQTQLFDQALLEQEELVDQIFPTERCVLVMATTRREIDYGDPWVNYGKNEINKSVFLMVRNGANIHRVRSPVESHIGAARLFPSKDGQDSAFRGFDGSQIKLDDVAYTDRLSIHEKKLLHYKRFLILACGLDHRLKLFGDFYDGPATFDFVSLGFQERSCRFLHDDDGAGLLPGEGRPALSAWIKDKNAHLRSGSRVLCNWSAVMTPGSSPSTCFHHRSGGGYERRYAPREATGLAIAFRDGDAVCVNVEVQGYSYSANADRKFNAKVTLTTLGRSLGFESVERPYLVLDAVTADDIRWYIRHRDSRRDHLSYIRFFKRALSHVEAELAAEADTRGRMAQALADGRVAADDEASGIIQQAVIAWRAAHRGRPLPRFDGNTPPAEWPSLLDQMFMLAGDGERRTDEIAAFAQDLGYEPLRLVLSGGARLVIYAAPSQAERDDRFEPHAWVHRITVERGKTKVIEKARRWAILPERAASETMIHEWSEAAAWAGLPSAFESNAHKAGVLDMLTGCADLLRRFSKPLSRDEFERQLDLCAERRAAQSSQYVGRVVFAAPFGLMKDYWGASALAVAFDNPFALLYRLAPDEEARQRARDAYLRPYASKVEQQRRFREAAEQESGWRLVSLPTSALRDGPYYDVSQRRDLEGRQHGDPRLAEWFANWRAQLRDQALWVAPDALDADDRLACDSVLSIQLPADYEPLVVLNITIYGDKNGPAPRYNRFFDLMAAEDVAKTPRPVWGGSFDLKRHTAGFGALGYSASTLSFASRTQALAFITASGRSSSDGANAHAVPAADLADAPAAPDGVERWYLAPSDSPTDTPLHAR